MGAEANYPVTIWRPFQKARTTNSTDTSFPTRAATVVEPVNDGVVALSKDGAIVPFRARLVPYGLGSSNDGFSMRVLGWTHIGSLWIPAPLIEVACVVGAGHGIAGTPVLATELFVDTITVVSEPTVTADVTRQGVTPVYSPANDTLAWLLLELQGVEKLEFLFDQTTNTPAMNCLIALL